MRIVHVSDCYAPRVGGIESQVADLAAHQVSQGHAVHVLTATAAETGTTTLGRYRETITEPSGVRVHRIASPVSLGLPVHPRGQALIRRALALLEPDVVHVHAGVVSPFAHDGARAARAAGLPLAITWHCMLDGVEPALALGARATGWRSARFAPSAVSGVAAERVAEALGRTDVSVMPNGLDLTPWRAVATGGDRTPSGVSARRGGGGPLRVVATSGSLRVNGPCRWCGPWRRRTSGWAGTRRDAHGSCSRSPAADRPSTRCAPRWPPVTWMTW